MTSSHQPIGPVDATRVPRYAGPPTFARLPRTDQVTQTDVAVVGVPFDSGVSYRPGARFGPPTSARRPGCCGPTTRAWTWRRSQMQQVADAGDIAVNPFDIAEAIDHDRGRRATNCTDGGTKLVTLGGDHTIALPLLRVAAPRPRPGRGGALRRPPRHLGHLLRRAVHPRHPVPPGRRGGPARPGALPARRHPRTAVRANGPRATTGCCGFQVIGVRRLPADGLADGHRADAAPGSARRPVYVSIDIDVLDPAHAPGTGTPEAGGMTSRELLQCLRSLVGVNVVGRRHRRGRARPTTTPRSPGSPPRTSPMSCCPCWRPAHDEYRNGGAAVVETLAAHGVDTVFGIPGTHNLELYRHFGEQRRTRDHAKARAGRGLRGRGVRPGERTARVSLSPPAGRG